MSKKETKIKRRYRRHKRIRARVKGTAQRPRLCVFRSLKHIYAQLIDDEKGIVLESANDLKLKEKRIYTKKDKLTKTEKAKEVGRLIAHLAKKKNIQKIVFDRGGYKYHGRVRALAEGAREGGLQF